MAAFSVSWPTYSVVPNLSSAPPTRNCVWLLVSCIIFLGISFCEYSHLFISLWKVSMAQLKYGLLLWLPWPLPLSLTPIAFVTGIGSMDLSNGIMDRSLFSCMNSSFSLSFLLLLTCKVRRIMVSSSWSCYRIKWDNISKCPKQSVEK